MDKHYFSLRLFFFLFLLISHNCVSQISGIVTINNTAAPSSTNFQSFSALASTLNATGISGPLTVNVIANTGPYNEQAVFNSIAGTSLTNTITINGNNNLLFFSAFSGTQPWTLLLNGSDFMYFNQLKVLGSGANFAMACVLSNGADYNNFSACTFSCLPNGSIGTRQYPLTISGSSTNPFSAGNAGNAGSYNTFYNCNTENGLSGITLSGYPGNNNSIINCAVRDWYGYGIFCQQQQSVSVLYCSIERPTRSVLPIGNTNQVTGITFGSPTVNVTMSGIICNGNCIQNLFGGAPNTICGVMGIYLLNPIPSQTIFPANASFSGNLIHNLGSNSSARGISLQAANAVVNNNTVIINNAQPTSTATSLIALYYAEYSPNATSITNNYFSISQPGSAQTFGAFLGFIGTPNSGVTINSNRYYIASTSSPNYIGYAQSLGNVTSFSQWQGIGYDLQGQSYSTNPNISVTSSCGINLPVPISNYIFPSGNKCQGASITFSDMSTNNPIGWNWSVNPTSGVSINSATSQNPQITFNAAGIYTVNLLASNVVGLGSAHSQSIAVANLPSVAINSNTSNICAGSSIQLTATGANTYTWNMGAQSSIITVTPQTSTVFSVFGTDLSGCVNNGSFALTVNELPTITLSAVDSVICAGGLQTTTLTANGALTYTWYPNNTIGNQISVMPTNPAIYTCVATSSAGCENSASIFINVYACLGLKNESKENGIHITLNQVQQNLLIKAVNNSFVNLIITNSLGEIILKKNNFNTSTTFDYSDLPVGVYILRVESENLYKTIKFLRD